MGWSSKYKKSIDCNNPKGFSQKAHCAGKKKRNERVMKISEFKEAVTQVLRERSINAISKLQQKNIEDVQKALDLYKKVKSKGDDKQVKKYVDVLKKLGKEKEKLAKELDMKVSGMYKDAEYKGESVNESYDSKTGLFYLQGVPFTRERMKEIIGMMMKGSSKPNSRQFEYENQVVVKDKSSNKKVVIDSKNLNKIIVFYRNHFFFYQKQV